MTMATTITTAAGQTTEPVLVLSYETVRNVPTLTHTIIGRGDPDVTLKPAGLRSGTLQLLYATEAEATAAMLVLTVLGTLVLADDDVASVGMTFVVTGDLYSREDEQTHRAWVVSVPYAEVLS